MKALSAKGEAGSSCSGRNASPRSSDDDERWRAIVERDSTYDGRFVYSVASTGVYCRPSCPSRQAKRSNVSFHATVEAARAAGFRPCKRCRPDAPSPKEGHARLVEAACRTIEAAPEAPTLGQLARQARLSPHHFHRLFKTVTGMTPKAFAAAHRANRARDALEDAASVTEAIYDAGYNTPGAFYAKAREMLGMTPTQFRNGGADMEIAYAIHASTLGQVLVAATPMGVCAVLMGDEQGLLIEDLRRRFPRARLSPADPAFERQAEKVIAHIEAPRGTLDLPLDIRGTMFQQRVWAALRSIPAGSTATYAEIAERIGAPRAVRAVAGACAANPIAVAVPCHRVVRADGSVSGYRWGVDRKKALLKREAKR